MNEMNNLMNEISEIVLSMAKSPLVLAFVGFTMFFTALRGMCNAIRYDVSGKKQDNKKTAEIKKTDTTKSRLLDAYCKYYQGTNLPTRTGFINFLAVNDMFDCIDLYTNYLDDYNNYWGL